MTRGQGRTRRRPRERDSLPAWTWAAAALFLAALIASCFKYAGIDVGGTDDSVYRSSAIEWLNGGNPYAKGLDGNVAGTPFTYPPFALIVFGPLALLSIVGVHNAMTLVTAACVAGMSVAVARAVTASPAARSPWRWLVALALVAGAFRTGNPVLWTLSLGQVSVAIAAMCLFDIVLLRRTPFAGVLIGLATAIKVTPALFIVYLLVVDRRAGVRATATAAAATLLAAVVLPGPTWRYFTEYLWDTSRVGDTAVNANVSITGMLARTDLTHTAAQLGWIAFTLLILAVSFVAVRKAWRIDSGVWAAAIIGQVTCLVAPFTWNHGAAWFSLAGALLVVWAVREQQQPLWIRGGVGLVGGTIIYGLYSWALLWNLPGAATTGLDGFVVQNTLFLVGIAGLAGLLVTAFRSVPFKLRASSTSDDLIAASTSVTRTLG